MQENDQLPRRGRDALVSHERSVLAAFRQARTLPVEHAFHAGDTVVIRWIFEFTGQDGRKRRMEELAYQRWQGNKIVQEQFFYDPAQMR